MVDPQDDMKKIEKNKGTMFDEAYKCIFGPEAYAAFSNWSNADSALPSCRLLWFKGYAGTGKTMLLMGIIRELSSHSATLAPKVSHFSLSRHSQGSEQRNGHLEISDLAVPYIATASHLSPTIKARECRCFPF